MVEFSVLGNPKPLKRHRHHKYGTYDPSKKDKEQFYIQILEHRPDKPMSGDIMVNLNFYMQRPKSHYRTGKYSHLLKPQAPRSCHSIKPDLDNLIKFVLDSIQGDNRFIKDDSMVFMIRASKLYDKNPRTEVSLTQLAG